MQQVETYIQEATAYIADPMRAVEAQKELRAHIAEAVADLTAQGIDPDTAEEVAITRMGAARTVAIPLAMAHHRHLPWRHYLAILPLSCMIAVLLLWESPYDWWRLELGWLPVLAFCLWPSPDVLRRFWRLLVVDIRAKFHWVKGQPLRSALISGGAAGLAAGLAFCVVVVQHAPGGAILIVPLAAVGTLWVMRRWWRSQPLLTAAFAAAGFPAGLVWIFLRPLSNDWYIVVGLLTVLFAFLAFAVGWAAQLVSRKGWLNRVKNES
ncbi:MAG: permease prefix domain 1-containing protein [Mycobacterium leprae]